jgi:threonine aldolase
MNFASDNTGPVHPKVMAAIASANEGYAMPYGNDPVTEAAVDAIRDLFEAPGAVVAFVPSGTAANSLALSCLVQPWDNVFCSRIAHIEVDECNAPEFFTGGAKMTALDEAEGRILPDALAAALEAAKGRSGFDTRPGALSLTQLTEAGTLYALDEIAALAGMARAAGMPVHLDGARFANACAALGCTPAEMTWKLGVDAVSFGGTKNGCLGAEAVVLFDPAHGRDLDRRRKRSGHVWSKARFLAAQMVAYVEDGLWLELGRSANAACARLVEAVAEVPGARLVHAPQGNMIWAEMPRAAHRRAIAAGARYYLYGGDAAQGDADDLVRCRLVCDWSRDEAEIDALRAAWLG